jgi:hypothetical protein
MGPFFLKLQVNGSAQFFLREWPTLIFEPKLNRKEIKLNKISSIW